MSEVERPRGQAEVATRMARANGGARRATYKLGIALSPRKLLNLPNQFTRFALPWLASAAFWPLRASNT